MKLQESLNNYMQTLKSEHRAIEAFASKALQDMGFPGPRAVTQVYKNGHQSLSMTYFADSEMNQETGEETGLRLLFEVEDGNVMKVGLTAFFRCEPTFDLVSVRVEQSEGVKNPVHIGLLEGEVRGKYEGSHIKHDKAGLQALENQDLLKKFVENSCALLCRAHFKP